MAVDGHVNWNVDLEVSLFHAMRRHKPVGVNRHFQMVFIHDKLNNSIAKNVSAMSIWTHLTEMYDLAALNESEILPFPNKDIEFRLPDHDYKELMSRDYPRASPIANRLKDERPPPLEELHHSATPQSSHHHGKGKGRDKEKEHKDKEAAVTPSHISKSHDAEDSPKREARKRTRQSLVESPAIRERETPAAKRPRRT